MQTLLTEAPPRIVAKVHVVRWVVFAFLVVASAAFGALAQQAKTALGMS